MARSPAPRHPDVPGTPDLPAGVPDVLLGEYEPFGNVALGDAERWPTLTPDGAAHLEALRHHPAAPSGCTPPGTGSRRRTCRCSPRRRDGSRSTTGQAPGLVPRRRRRPTGGPDPCRRRRPLVGRGPRRAGPHGGPALPACPRPAAQPRPLTPHRPDAREPRRPAGRPRLVRPCRRGPLPGARGHELGQHRAAVVVPLHPWRSRPTWPSCVTSSRRPGPCGSRTRTGWGS
ncbi:hypothetical protein NKG05_17870 [Oerskovia sp. M15]